MAADSKSILMVEDDADFCGIMVPELESHGFRVTTVATVQAAAEAVKRESPDLMVVDGLLPDTDGVTWISELRQSGNRTKIIFITAYWKDHKSFDWMREKLDVAKVMLKPIQPEDLAKEAKMLLGDQAPPEKQTAATQVQERMRTLRLEYGKKLPEKVQSLSRLGGDIENTEGNPDLVAETRQAAHRLRGTAGIYGHPKIGEAAGVIEDILSRWLKEQPRDNEALFAQLKNALTLLNDALRQNASQQA
ncbi:MAG: response regulator [SAR324 cluster bacterium]|nr:response regulator [SAR324 cluster bacterium]